MRPLVPPEALLNRHRAADSDRLSASADGGGPPELVLNRLADLALLHGVPFEYLVPDPALLPPESLRFFRIDPQWVAALHAGVLAVGERSTADALARRASGVPKVASRTAAVRDRRRGRACDAANEETEVTGFLLRSQLVTDYPGLQVRGAAGPAAAPLLRLDRPAAGVLIALFAGILTSVTLEEPHHGIRLGVDGDLGAAFVRLRGSDGRLVQQGGAAPGVPVPFRPGGATDVIDVTELARRITQAAVPGVPPVVGSGTLALQLFQAPVRQRFERPSP